MKKEESSHASVKWDLEEHFVTKEVSLLYNRSMSPSYNTYRSVSLSFNTYKSISPSSISRDDPMTGILHVPLVFIILHVLLS